jgi:hypothetical protein
MPSSVVRRPSRARSIQTEFRAREFAASRAFAPSRALVAASSVAGARARSIARPRRRVDACRARAARRARGDATRRDAYRTGQTVRGVTECPNSCLHRATAVDHVIRARAIP